MRGTGAGRRVSAGAGYLVAEGGERRGGERRGNGWGQVCVCKGREGRVGVFGEGGGMEGRGEGLKRARERGRKKGT